MRKFILLVTAVTSFFATNVYGQCSPPWSGNGTQSSPWDISDYSTAGNNVSAYISGSTLFISGNNFMADFWTSAQGEAPWWCANRQNEIQTVVFQSGSNVKNIGNRAFKDCNNLKTITIPSSVMNINEQAFYNCTSLQEIEIPNTVRVIRGEAFRNCVNLQTLIIQNGINYDLFFYGYCYWSVDGSITREDETWCSSWTRKYFSGCSSLQELHLGRNIQASTYSYQSDDFFYGNSTVQTLTVGNTVYSFSNPLAIFENWYVLKFVTLEDGTANLSFANTPQFKNCPIQTFHWGRNIVDINYWDNSPLYNKSTVTTVSIGSNVGSIGNYAFYNCINLTTITSKRQMPPIAGSLAFFGVNKSTCAVNVPQDSRCTYKKTENWKDFENIIDGTTYPCENKIEDRESGNLQVFPNPTTSEIYIKSDSQIIKVEIYSIIGELLVIENNFKEKMSVSDLSNGIYLLKVYTDKGLSVGKFAKE